MQSTEKQKFEESWKKAFDGAEMAPPDGVWSSIELDIAGQESAAMKKRIVFWQRLAAAMLIFALGAGAYGYYSGSQKSEVRSQEMASVKKESGDELKDVVRKSEVTSQENQAETEVKTSTTISGAKARVKEDAPAMLALAEPTTPGSPSIKEEEQQQSSSVVEERSINEEKSFKEEESVKKEEKKEETIAVVSPLLQQIEEPEEVVKPKKRARENNLWLALGASAGNYSPNTPSATTVPQNSFAGPMNSLIAAAPQRSEPKVGQSYSFGMSVGKKFGRVVVQTGVNLGRQQVEYTSNYNAIEQSSNSANYTAKAASADYLDTQGQSFAMAFTPSDYTVNSTMEIISIPVQAGYMIIDRQIGWQFNAGVSPDFFLKNVLVDESGQRERLTQTAGSSSPYRSVNWSGLLNTELSYRVGAHYRLSVVPGVRYSFNSILKEPTSSGRPVILDIGFRFKYIFD